jgi:hypothetical protein
LNKYPLERRNGIFYNEVEEKENAEQCGKNLPFWNLRFMIPARSTALAHSRAAAVQDDIMLDEDVRLPMVSTNLTAFDSTLPADLNQWWAWARADN